MNRFRARLFLVAFGTFASTAHATFIANSFGLTSPHQTLDFESVVLTQNQTVTNEFQSAGVTFVGAYGNADTTNYPNLSGNRIGNFQSGIGESPLFRADFTSTLSEAAFALVTAPGTTTFSALLNGILVESAQAATSAIDFTNYFGFKDILFNQITISVVSSDRTFLLDNLQSVVTSAAVPEPASSALVAASLGALVWSRRKALRCSAPTRLM